MPVWRLKAQLPGEVSPGPFGAGADGAVGLSRNFAFPFFILRCRGDSVPAPQPPTCVGTKMGSTTWVSNSA